MGEKMTRDEVLVCAKSMKFYGHDKSHRALLEYAAHLSTPAQTVDVDAVREVITSIDLRAETYLDPQCKGWADKLSQAIDGPASKR
jgi:hypothetical protein